MPVAQQGKSRNFKAYDADAPIDRRPIRIVWAVEAVLAAIFAVIVVLAVAYRLLPGMLGPALILTWLPAAIWLREPARRRPYPTRAAKVAAFAAVSVFLIGYVLVVLVATGVIDLHSTTTSLSIVLAIVSYAIALIALVFAYRARFFYWRAP